MSDYRNVFKIELNMKAYNRWGQPYLSYLCIFITEVKRELQVSEEVVREFWIHVQHLQNVLPLNGLQVTIT